MLFFFSFLHLHVRSFSISFLPFPSIYGAVFERMFKGRCLCAIIRQYTITLSLSPSPFFVLLICNCSLVSAHSVYLHLVGHHF